MAQVPTTDVTTISVGGSAYTVPFLYQNQAEVFVEVDGVATAFTWINSGNISITPAPVAGAKVRRYRSTAATSIRHDFRNGVPFTPKNITENNDQLLYVVQETVNDTAGTAAAALTQAEQAVATADAAAGRVDVAVDLIDAALQDSALYLRNDLANTTDPAKGSALVGFLQAGAGAVGRTMLDKAREVVSVKDFGAVGDGVADDTAAIQAAINFIVSQAFRPTLIFPKGIYLTGTLIANGGNMPFMRGEGSSQSVLRHRDGESAALLQVNGRTTGSPTPAAPYFGYEGLTFRAGDGTTALIYYAGQIDNNVKWHDLQFIGYNGTATCHAISVRDYLNWHISKVRFDGVNGYCVEVRDAQYFSNSVFHLDNWTYDSQANGRSQGVFFIDLSATALTKGVVNFSNARLEVNSAINVAKPARSLFRVLQNSAVSSSIPAQVLLKFDSIVVDVVSAARDLKMVSTNLRNVGIETNDLTTYGLNQVFGSDDNTGKVIFSPVNTTLRFKHSTNFAERFDGNLNGRSILFEGLKVGTISTDNNLTTLGGLVARGDFFYHSNPTNSGGVSQGLRPFAIKSLQSANGYCSPTASNLAGTGSITSGTNQLVMSTALDTRTVPGVSISIPGAGAAGATLVTSILSVDYITNTITTDANASTTVSGVTVAYTMAQFGVVNTSFYASGAPSSGTFAVGDRSLNTGVWLSSPVTDYVCIAAGTPGTWRQMAHHVRISATANRPALTSNDIGVMYMDTTLAPNGKPIWWNGTAWVDAMGSVV